MSGPCGLEIVRAARHLVRRFGVVEGARRAGVHRSTLRAAAANADGTSERTALRIVRAGRSFGAFAPQRCPVQAAPCPFVASARGAVVVSLDAARSRRSRRVRT